MAPKTSKLDLRTASGQEIAAEMRPGSIAALPAHKRARLPVAVWDYATGTTVWVSPEEIPDLEQAPLPAESHGVQGGSTSHSNNHPQND
jgi:hypothetical protein